MNGQMTLDEIRTGTEVESPLTSPPEEEEGDDSVHAPDHDTEPVTEDDLEDADDHQDDDNDEPDS